MKYKYILLIAKLLFILIPCDLRAEEMICSTQNINDGLSASYKQCINQSNGETINMLNCIVTETKSQDVSLNKIYQQLLKELPQKRIMLLKQSQRMWLGFVKINCDFKINPNGGTSESLVANGCYMDSIAARVQELENVRKTIDLQ